MSRITQKTTLKQLAAIVVKALLKRKIEVALTGGAVVSIYTNNPYASRDLDFISSADHAKIREVMSGLGFKSKGKDFVHPKSEFTVEFPTGPLSLGGRVPVAPEGKEIINGVQVVMLSPTQSVMDRLIAFYNWNDPQSLDQAIAICRSRKVNIEVVRKWSEEEDENAKFEEFHNELKRQNIRTK